MHSRDRFESAFGWARSLQRPKHKWLMVWCSAVVQLTPVHIYDVRQRWGGTYVGMLLSYSRHVIVSGEPVCRKPPQNEGLQKKIIIRKMKKEHELSRQNIRICEIQMPHGKELLQPVSFSLQLDDSIWSIDVNKLEWICFKYPLKVNWHCWNRCIRVWHCGQQCCFFGFFLSVNKESS